MSNYVYWPPAMLRCEEGGPENGLRDDGSQGKILCLTVLLDVERWRYVGAVDEIHQWPFHDH